MASRDYIFNNFWWKLLSLLMAALTWLTIDTAFKRDEQRRQSPVVTGASTRTFPAVPITLMTSTTNTNHFVVSPATVSVEVSGTDSDLLTLQFQDVKAYVDVTDAGDQKQFRRVIQAQVPKNLKVASLSRTNASVDRITSSK